MKQQVLIMILGVVVFGYWNCGSSTESEKTKMESPKKQPLTQDVPNQEMTNVEEQRAVKLNEVTSEEEVCLKKFTTISVVGLVFLQKMGVSQDILRRLDRFDSEEELDFFDTSGRVLVQECPTKSTYYFQAFDLSDGEFKIRKIPLNLPGSTYKKLEQWGRINKGNLPPEIMQEIFDNNKDVFTPEERNIFKSNLLKSAPDLELPPEKSNIEIEDLQDLQLDKLEQLQEQMQRGG